jgi:osmotically inducible protein OsmC
VRGTVPGLDEDGFRAAAEDAKKNCPVSQALSGIPDVSLDASIAS